MFLLFLRQPVLQVLMAGAATLAPAAVATGCTFQAEQKSVVA
ncbi:hypothetical protein ECTW09098_5906 [Escherichia coli TW09098]|nr:hypothetical protein ECTW09098_5906 [Escherichia coli TW09098]